MTIRSTHLKLIESPAFANLVAHVFNFIMRTTLNLSLLALLFSVLSISYVLAGSGAVPTTPEAQRAQATESAHAQLQPQAETTASAELQAISPAERKAVQADAASGDPATPQAQRPRLLEKRGQRGGFFAGMIDWFGNRKLIKKAESKASAKSPLVAGMVRLGIILMVVGVAVMLVGIVFDGSIGSLFYSLGAICFVVGLVLLILGLVGIL